MSAKAKGVGAGGCCCGGCAQKPMDARTGNANGNSILQGTCCRCIPDSICIFVEQEGYDSQNVYVFRQCSESSYEGDPIQYEATIFVSGISRTLYVRMFASYGDCYIGWDIPALDIGKSTLIDPEIPSTICNLNMEPKQCSEFGGEWLAEETDSPAISITITEAPTRSVKDLIECGGCNCICDCMCLSVWSRSATTIWTVDQSNAVACSVLTEAYLSGCGITNFWKAPNSLSWSIDGWTMTLDGGSEWPIYSATIDSGTGTISGTCSVQESLYLTDGFTHTIDGSSAQVTYEFRLEERIAKGYKWAGTTHDENAVLTIEVYDWVSAAWIVFETRDGRADAVDTLMVSARPLRSEFTGTGANEGYVRIRLTTTGDQIVSDMLRLQTSDCCYLTLTPPYGIVPATPLAKYKISGECPSPEPIWQFTDTDDIQWNFAATCSFCGGVCGAKITTCCARPLPRFLFAEVDIDCPGCVGVAFVVPLDAGATGVIWSGCSRLCGSTGESFCMSITCSGGVWTLSITTAPGGCSLAGGTVTASSASCEPVSIVFTGTLQAGLFCCGPDGGANDTPAITITVIE
jgi:hypothetical protein